MGADFERVLEEIQTKLNAPAVAVQLPIGAAETFEGMIDLVNMVAYRFSHEDHGSQVEEIDIPSELVAEAEEQRAKLIEQVADQDEALLEAFMENSDVSAVALKEALRRRQLPTKWYRFYSDLHSKTKGCNLCWMRWSPTCLLRSMFQR